MSKKILLIILIVVIIGGVGYFVWQKNRGTAEGGSNGFSFKSFFPFDNGDETAGSSDNKPIDKDTPGSDNNQPIRNPASLPKLRKISEGPVAGAVMLASGSTTLVRFVEKATGNIYEARSDSGSTKRLTNTTIPKIIRAFWLPQGDGLLAQTVGEDDLVETAFLKLSPAKATSSESYVPYNVTISKLPTGIQELSIRPDGKKIIYYTDIGISDWYISNPDGTGSKRIYQNDIRGWVPQWYSADKILIVTKASYLAPSFGYVFNTLNNQIIKTFGGILGESAKISPDGKNVLLSGGEDKPVLNVFNVDQGSRSSIGSYTFSEKCAWDPSDANYVVCGIPQKMSGGKYPDDWYKGLFSTSDLIERINVNDNIVYIAANPSKDVQTDIDVKEMYVSKNGKYSAFLSKDDSNLWLLRMRE